MNRGRDRDDRDRAIERLLQKSQATRDLSTADPCPDAETIAAWLDGGLSRSEIVRVEGHASNCTRCQTLLAAAAETTPSAAAQASERRWWHGWHLRWFVPLVAGTAVVILWVAAPNEERPDLPQQANAELSKAVPAAAPPDEKADQFSAPSALSEPPGAANETSAKAENKNASARTEEREQRKDNSASEGQNAAALDKLADQKSASPPAAASTDAAAQAPSPLAETVAVQRQAFRFVPNEITSPDPAIRWRIAAGGSVERTTNGGTTWESTPTGITADLTAGASPSPLVCWLVGRSGTVLLSTDGRTWRRVPFPEMTDLATVQAANAQTATVTATDGRTFRTTDGGLTWVR